MVYSKQISKFNMHSVTTVKMSLNGRNTVYTVMIVKMQDYLPLNFNPGFATVCTFFTCSFKQKVKCNYLWYLTCSSTLPGLPSSAGRSVSTD